MKLPAGLFLLCLALAVSVRAEEVTPVKKEVPEVKRELVWPEIKDPQALIDFAKAEIKRVGDSDKKWGRPITLKSEFAYLNPGDCYVQSEYLVIELDTHPVTGQALLVLPNSSLVDEKTAHSLAKIEETKTTGIKRVLLRLGTFSEYSASIYEAYEHGTVCWRNFKNLSNDKTTWPIPIELRLPVFPVEAARQGVIGYAEVGFIVTEEGSTSTIT